MIVLLIRLVFRSAHHVVPRRLFLVSVFFPGACAAVVVDSNGVMAMAPAITMHVASKIGDFVVVVLFVSVGGIAVSLIFVVVVVVSVAVVVVVVGGGGYVRYRFR